MPDSRAWIAQTNLDECAGLEVPRWTSGTLVEPRSTSWTPRTPPGGCSAARSRAGVERVGVFYSSSGSFSLKLYELPS